MTESKDKLTQSSKFQPEMANKRNIPAISQYSVQFYTRKYCNDFRFIVDNHKSSKCGKKCQNYENIQDTAKFQLLIARDRAGNDESSARNR